MIRVEAFIKAAKSGDLETLSAFLSDEHFRQFINLGDRRGATALMYAAMDGRLEMVKALISAGANLDVQDNAGYTALMLAVQAGHHVGHTKVHLGEDYTEVVRLLIKSGADVNRRSHANKLAAELFNKNEPLNFPIHLALSGAQEALDELMQVVKLQDHKAIKQKLKEGYFFNLPDLHGNKAIDYVDDHKLRDQIILHDITFDAEAKAGALRRAEEENHKKAS